MALDRATTYEGYECLLRCHVPSQLREIPLSEVTSLDLQRVYAELLTHRADRRAMSGGTVLNLHLVLMQALGQAMRWQLISLNPAASAQPPRPRRREPISVSPELLERLISVAVRTPLELPVAIAAATGMRRGEILGLRWSDLAKDYSFAHVRASLQATREGLSFERPKTARSRRAVALPAFLRPFLERQRTAQAASKAQLACERQDAGLVVTRTDGSPVNPDSMSSAWRRLLRKHDLPPVRFHDLRHAHATLMLLQGVHPKVVSERLGHASVGITLDTYSHVLPSMQAQAVEAFDRLFPQAT
jgi:integrase